MNSFFRKRLPSIFIFCIAFFLQACGNSDDPVVYQITSDTESITFTEQTTTETSHSEVVEVNYTGDDLLLAFAPDTTPVDWLSFTVNDLTETSANIQFEVFAEGTFPPGIYEATVRMSAGSLAQAQFAHHDIQVTLTVWTSNTVSFLAKAGNNTLANQSLDVHFNSAWVVESDLDWLSFEQLTDEEKSTLIITPLLTGEETVGVNKGNITITETASNAQVVIPVELAIDNTRLVVNQQALILSHTLSFVQLNVNLAVSTNNNSVVNWQATSEQSWLSLTENTDSNILSIAADASGLSNGVHQGSITISTSEVDKAESTSVNVSFYVSDLDSQIHTINNVSLNDYAVFSPTQPYFYYADGNTVKTLNILTGEIINSTTSLMPDLDIGNLVIHPDGSVLLFSNIESYQDEDDNEQQRINHYQLDLTSNQITAINSSNVSIAGRPIGIEIIDGTPMVITHSMEFATIDLSRKYQDTAYAFVVTQYAKPANSNNISFVNHETKDIETFQFEYNSLSSQPFNFSYKHSYQNENFIDNLYALVYSTNGLNLLSANSNTELSQFEDGKLVDLGVINKEIGAEALSVATDYKNNSYFYHFLPNSGFTMTKYNGEQSLLYSTFISTELSQPYINPHFQVVLTYNATESTLTITPFSAN